MSSFYKHNEAAEDLQMGWKEAREHLESWGCPILTTGIRTWRVDKDDYHAAINRQKAESLEKPRRDALKLDYIKGGTAELPDFLGVGCRNAEDTRSNHDLNHIL